MKALLFLVGMASVCLSGTPDRLPVQTALFVAGQDGYHSYRIPAIVVTVRGTLLAFCEGRKNSLADHGDIDLLVKRSHDGGKTWSPQEIVWDDANHTIGNPCPVVDRTTGTVWLPFCRDNREVFVTQSTDDGKTWVPAVEITAQVKPAGWTWYATGPVHGIQLRSGRLLIPSDHRETSKPGIMFSHVIYSDDHGATWKVGGSPGEHTDECSAVECSDGSVCLNMRSYHKKNRRAVARSRDGGQTWSPVTLDPALVEPTCQGSIVRYQGPRTEGPQPILFSNPASTQRKKMTVRITRDDCTTWDAGKSLYAGLSAYSDLCVLPDGTIACLYERGQRHAYETITLARFTLDWLTAKPDAGASQPVPIEPSPSPARGTIVLQKHLLLDDRVIDRTENVRLTPGRVTKDPCRPLFQEDRPWEPRFDNLYANVLHDEGEGLYKCWYSPFIIDERTTGVPRDQRSGRNYIKVTPNHREMGVCYAVSSDGITWEKPDLGLVEFNGSKANNLVLRGPHGAGVFRDARDQNSARRYKMFTKSGEPGDMAVAFSADGLRWSRLASCPEIGSAGDTHNNAFWAAELGKFVGITRMWSKQDGRLVGRCESEDFLKWTKAVDVMHRLPADPHRQTYAMPVFRYANVYLGLVMLLDTKTDLVDCELAWSPDTVRWERVCPGTPMIPRGAASSYDSGCIYAAACPIVRPGEIRLYYGGSNGPHTTWRDGFFCLARLRPDGFAGYEPSRPETAGTVITAPILCTGKQLVVSADAEGGSLRVGIEGDDGLSVERSQPITTNVTDAGLRWQGGRDLSPWVGRTVRVRLELKAAKAYALAFAQ